MQIVGIEGAAQIAQVREQYFRGYRQQEPQRSL
jgi:hypothetical protein